VSAVIRFTGVVQGVGFRPLVYRTAVSCRLAGSVRNTERGVVVEVDGTRSNIEGFYKQVLADPPVLADIHESTISYGPARHFKEFHIADSSGGEGFTPVSPDIATCDECLDDVFDTENRRYRYPFTNCTNCGPRFTIIRTVPYDRRNTTMDPFSMCRDCSEEYHDPGNRRYHAQPNACGVCGPALDLHDAVGGAVEGDPVRKAVGFLGEGAVLAVKGLGGFHLAVEPRNDAWVRRLRQRKRRPSKPFALMVRSMDTARKYCIIDRREEELLLSRERPIVLLRRKPSAESGKLPRSVAPDTHYLGLFLPYTPLHHLLLSEGPDTLIMTSANLSEEPLCFRNEDALESLGGIADYFLSHNRGIARPCDDSVLAVVDSKPVFIRRSRGYVPLSVKTNDGGRVFAAGAHEKNTFCVMREGNAYVSQHIGDLDNAKSIDAYTNGIEDFIRMFRVEPEIAACDAHPDYASTRYARELAERWGCPLVRVQHHHAHIASVLAEHGIRERVIGIALDGTGFGADGAVWGGEFLIASTAGFRRAGHFGYVPMPGGEYCIRETDRMAAALLINAYGGVESIPRFDFFDRFGKKKLETMQRMILSKLNTPLTSSCGRLFDGVSALIGLCSRPTYEAQGAVLLESCAGDMQSLDPYPFRREENGVLLFDETVRRIVDDLRMGESPERMARRFHSTIIRGCLDMTMHIRKETRINRVALSGGVFQNRLMIRHLAGLLKENGFEVFRNMNFPPNDGGISLGQGVIALESLKGGDG